MRKNELLDLLESVLGSCSGKFPEYIFDCFECNHHKKKLCVNLNKKLFHCWVCEFKGNLRYLVKNRDRSKLQEYDSLVGYKNKNVIESDISVRLPFEYKTFVNSGNCFNSKNAFSYLNKRGINYYDIVRYNVGFATSGSYSNRIIFPSFDGDGKLNYFVGRTFYEDDKRAKYKNEKIPRGDVIFNEHLIDWSKPIILTEGIFDSIIAGQNSIPLLGSLLSIRSKLYKKIILKKPIVYLALDIDAYDKSIKIMKKLIKNDIAVHFVDLRPYNDINECGKHVFENKLKHSKSLTMLEIVQAELAML